ncbi:MAG: autotransporter outer membrane beta-barrel domain-containing protein [Desulfovibrio sp.]|nr:autotransporter outer membrane beta-barrel domain-containing protein [Desulfovibrio sp.]
MQFLRKPCRISIAILWLGLVFLPATSLAQDTDGASAYDVGTANAINGRTFTLHFYHVDEQPDTDPGEESLKASVRQFMNAEKNDILRAANHWTAILKPGSKNVPLSSYNAFLNAATEETEDNAHCGGGFTEDDPNPPFALAILEGKKQANDNEFGQMSVGYLTNSVIGLNNTALSADNAYLGTIFHEIGHALGLSSSDFDTTKKGQSSYIIRTVNIWDSHLRDFKGNKPALGMLFTKNEEDKNEPDTFFVGNANTSGVVFVGTEVAKVLSDGKTGNTPTEEELIRYAIPINGMEGEGNNTLDLSHTELNRSLMSHQEYRNYSTFMEGELALLQDMGYQIDRNLFYGQSLYLSGTAEAPLAATISQAHTDVSGVLGVGLHVYGSYRDIAVNAPITVTGESGTGIRVDGSANTLTINSSILAENSGKESESTGLLVAYGKNHVVTIGKEGSVSGRGMNSIGARFDFGNNLCGNHNEYRGSYIRTAINKEGNLENLPLLGSNGDGLHDAIPLNLDGSLVSSFTVEGRLYGRKAAIFISENALVSKITIAKGASVIGDIVSEWNAKDERIQYSGSRNDLLTTLTVDGSLLGSINGKNGIRFINNADSLLSNVAVARLENNNNLSISQGCQLLVTGKTTLAASKTLTLASNAQGVFEGGLQLKNGAILTLQSGAQANVAPNAALSYGTNSRITMNSASFEADASTVLDIEESQAVAKTNASTLFRGSKDSTLTLRLADPFAGYTLSQLDSASNALSLDESVDLAFVGTLNLQEGDELAMRVDESNATVSKATPMVYGDTNRSMREVRYNEVALENAQGDSIAPQTLTIADSAFTLSNWRIAETRDTTSLVVKGASNLTITGFSGKGSIFVTESGAKVPTNLTVTDTSSVFLGSSDEQNEAIAMDFEEIAVKKSAELTMSNLSTVASTLAIDGGTLELNNTVMDVNRFAMNGGLLTIDPSALAVQELSTDSIAGQIVVGSGSVAILDIKGLGGIEDVESAIQSILQVESAQNIGEGYAVLALGSNVTLDEGGALYVDPQTSVSGTELTSTTPFGNVSDISSTNQTVFFAPSSLFIVNGKTLSDEALITAQKDNTNHTARIESGAELTVLNPVKGSFTLLENFAGGITAYGWQKVTSKDRMLTIETALAEDDTALDLNIAVNAPSEVFPGMSNDLAPAVRKVWDRGINDVDATAGGVRFLSRAAHEDYMPDAGSAARTIESAARIALVGAVPSMTYASNNAAVNAIVGRIGRASPTNLYAMDAGGNVSAGDATNTMHTGFAMWITPLFQSWNGFGLEGGELNMDVNGRLGGVALGADYTFENNIRTGLSFNIGGGYANGSGDFSDTKNSFNFWGIGAYAGWAPNAFSLTADVNFTSTFHKVRQDLPGSLGMGDELKTDMFASALSAGLRGEYLIKTTLDIIPHVGVRSTWLHVDDYDVKAGGRKVLKGNAFSQHIWSFPLGVAFSKSFETESGWHITPQMDLQLTPHAGDVDAKAYTRFTGVPKKAELETQVFDRVTYGGQVGLEFGKDNIMVGVNYNLQVGAHSSAHGLFGTLRYEF